MATGMGMPFGDAFIVGTPALDRLGQQLYVEQKQREQTRQKEAAALDAGMQKEIGKMRSIDTPEAISAYNDYKKLATQALMDRSLQNDIQKRNQVLQAAQLAKAKVMQIANGSAELKEQDKQMDAARLTHPDLFVDDYYDRMTARRNTPLSQLKNHPQYGDLSNPTGFMYQGGDADLETPFQKAKGQLVPKYTETVPVQNGLANQSTVYSSGNDAENVKQQYLGALAVRKMGRAAAYELQKLPPGTVQKTLEAVKNIDPIKLKQLGYSAPPDLTPKNWDNQAEVYASYRAADDLLHSTPKVEVKNPVINYEAQANRHLKDNLILEGVRHGDRMAEAKFKKKLDSSSDEEKATQMNALYDSIVSDAKKGEIHSVPTPNGSMEVYRAKQMPSISEKAFVQTDSKGHKRMPDELYYTEDGNWLPIYYKKDKDGMAVKDKKTGEVEIIHEWSQPVLASVVQAEIGAKFLPKKDAAKALNFSLTPKVTETEPPKKTPITVKAHKGMFD